MIHAYHVIWGTHGFWLPNDPRGSWSELVASWELARFGSATKSLERREVDVAQWRAWRAAAETALRYPSVHFTGGQARAVGKGFANAVRKSGLTIWARSILPEHVHLVVARHTYKAEQICNLLKGEATKELIAESLHPLAALRLRVQHLAEAAAVRTVVQERERRVQAPRGVVDDGRRGDGFERCVWHGQGHGGDTIGKPSVFARAPA